mmetsp:Transcript_18270/g.48493  ORF Transcript_18270/g.48493 Transcript_18270/m.48493 type:complete len:233 (+) Transcript_18270:78-776(+)
MSEAPRAAPPGRLAASRRRVLCHWRHLDGHVAPASPAAAPHPPGRLAEGRREALGVRPRVHGASAIAVEVADGLGVGLLAVDDPCAGEALAVAARVPVEVPARPVGEPAPAADGGASPGPVAVRLVVLVGAGARHTDPRGGGHRRPPLGLPVLVQNMLHDLACVLLAARASVGLLVPHVYRHLEDVGQPSPPGRGARRRPVGGQRQGARHEERHGQRRQHAPAGAPAAREVH